MENKTIDITTLQGYADLPEGTYDITVTANREGFAPSPASQPARYTKSIVDIPFMFDGTTGVLAGYTGTDTNIVIPSKYGIREEQLVLQGAELNHTHFDTNWKNIVSNAYFSKLKFKNKDSGTLYEYTAYQDYVDNFETDFPDKSKALLYYVEVTRSNAFATMSRYLAYPVTVEFGTFNDYIEFALYTSNHSDITSITFGGTIVITHYTNGNNYNVTGIGTYAFYNSSITSVTIPNGVTSIENNAFHDCSSLTSITISSSVASIGDRAFSGCSGLTSISIPNSVTSIGISIFYNCTGLTSVTIQDGVTSIGRSMFSSCSSLTSITIPDSVTSIGSSAFDNCISLTSIVLPNGVTNIDSNTFSGCSSLTSITIPDSVTSIGSSAFENCTSLTTFNYAGTIAQWAQVTKDSKWKDDAPFTVVHCTDGDYEIPSPAVLYYTGTQDVKMTWEELQSGNYMSYSSGTLVGGINKTQLAGDLVVGDGNGITSIIYDTFKNCTSLTSITIPDGVTSIGTSVFAGCTSLTSITIPDSVTSIGSEAFSNCTGLTSITIPDSVTSIGSQAFYQCTNLTTINLSNSVTSIGSSTFYQCTSLTTISIPSRVTFIGNDAFYECTSLTSINIPSSVTSIGIRVFRFCYDLTTLIVNANYNNTENSNTLTSGQNYGYGQTPSLISTSDYSDVYWTKVT